jgi:hypothetical protein
MDNLTNSTTDKAPTNLRAQGPMGQGALDKYRILKFIVKSFRL